MKDIVFLSQLLLNLDSTRTDQAVKLKTVLYHRHNSLCVSLSKETLINNLYNILYSMFNTKYPDIIINYIQFMSSGPTLLFMKIIASFNKSLLIILH